MKKEDYVAIAVKVLKVTKEVAIENNKEIAKNVIYFWNPVKGGLHMIIGNDGTYLAATSAVNPDKLIEEFNNGKRN